MSNPLHVFYFVVITLCWGGSFLGIGVAVGHFPPFFSAFLRSFIGMTGAALYMIAKKRGFRFSKTALHSMGAGLFTMGIAWVFLFWGEKYVSPAVAAILNSTVPVFTVLLTPLITPQDKLGLHKWLGVLLGFAGVVVIFQPALSMVSRFYLEGLAAILLMAVCYAIGLLWTRRLTRNSTGAFSLFYQCLSSSLFLLAASALFELPKQPLAWSWSGFSALMYLGIFSTTLAWLLFFRLIKNVGSVQAASVTYCVPLVAMILDFFFWDKWLSFHQLIGALIILAGVFLIHFQKARFKVTPAQKTAITF